MRNGNVLRFACVIGLVALALAACGDDEDTTGDAGGSGGAGGGGAGSDASTGDPDGDVTGKACTSNQDCGGGTCATQITGTSLTPEAAPGGYCTAACTSDAECGMGGACIGAVPSLFEGTCLATCEATRECRDGYVCTGGLAVGGLVIPDTCRPAPATDQLEDDVAGKACAAAADCPGGQCLTERPLGGPLPGGYCSGACLEDAHCGAGGLCLPSLLGGAGSCYEACANDGECTREGYRCRPLRGALRGCNPAADPLPDGAAGKACASDADCGGGADTCASELPRAGLAGALGQSDPAAGGYCSQSCLEDLDCGAGGACVVVGLGGRCFKRCTGAGDCRDGYACEDRAVAPIGADAGAPEPLLVCAALPSADEDAGR